MDPLAVVLLRRTGLVAVPGSRTGPADGPAWVAALEADLAGRGWLLRDDLRAAAARLPTTVRVRWADWLLATVDEMVGADRPMLPLYRSFPDTPRNTEAVYVRRLLTHLFAVPGAPCVLCGREDGGAPLDPCGHLVCSACFPPDLVTACPICGRRLSADNTFLPIVELAAPKRRDRHEPAVLVPMRLAGLEFDLMDAAARLRDELVARPGALSEADRADLEVLVAATAPGRLDWLPEVVPA
ncbi:MAG TPA: RING finger family 4 domain-containing protein, partial [Asanoa sp.]|nr:RING finger family 4 domain-containing protein [Asanoa sp.]